MEKDRGRGGGGEKREDGCRDDYLHLGRGEKLCNLSKNVLQILICNLVSIRSLLQCLH